MQANGGLNEYIKSHPKKKLRIPENPEIAKEEKPIEKNLDELLFYNGYGGFSQDGREYKFCVNKDNSLPTVWSNIISNKSFGIITTENMYDLIWNKNSRLNRITAWNNDTVCNIPSQIFYLKDEETNKIWTLNSNVFPNPNYYYVTYGFGYSKYKNVYDDILQQMDIFVPNDDNVAITKIRFKNTSDKVKDLKMMVYIKTVLGEDENHSSGNCYFEKKENTILMKNVLNSYEFNKIAYFSSNVKIKGYTKSKRVFFGNGSLTLPDCLFVNNFESCSGIGDCLGVEIGIHLKEYEEKYLILGIGQENTLPEIEQMSNKVKNMEYVNKSLTETNRKWMNLISNLNIKTPDDKLNILVNGWLVYQTIGCRLWGKSGFYQSGGANGFRDQLQDCLGMKYIDSNLLREQIIKCCRHQFIEGDVLHWWHDETKKGVRTRFSDDLLWLPYSVFEYISFSGDEDVLEEQIEYLAGEKLKDTENEAYHLYFASEIKENVYEHCIRAIDKACAFGERGLPKIGSGDWNDGFSNVGVKGKGESIWLGFFLYDVLNKFSKICEKRKDLEKMEQYHKIKEELKKNLNTNGWDGRWYKRAIMDDNTEIGSIESQECKIDSISQSWSVISGAGDNDKKYISMQEVQNRLVDKENKLIKLFTPPFSNWEINPGYIKAYPEGMRENGGQYTHAAIWTIIANCLLGFGDNAVELLNLINPIEHSKNSDFAKKYKVEPYVMVADIYSNENHPGMGGWSWYTGSSSWYYDAIVEYVLGLKQKDKYLYIEPCIASYWKEYEIHYKYKTSMYHITVKNPEGKNTGVKKFLLNDNEIAEKKILLQDDCKIYNIEIIM